MRDRILLDADVLLDVFFDRKPFVQYAAQILSWCDLGVIQGFITPVICSNVYYLLQKHGSHAAAIAKLRQVITIVDMLVMDKNTVVAALESNFTDFEDALHYMAALHSNAIDYILTRNIRDYRQSKITVLTPEAYLTHYWS